MRFRRQVPWATRNYGPAKTRPVESESAKQPHAVNSRQAPFLATVGGRRLVRDGLILVAIFGIGYLVASAWLSPVPLVTTDHAVPRVLELPAGEAQRKLGELGFRVKFEDERPNPSIPRGGIVWQDPPPGTILGQNSVISLTPSAGLQQVPVPDLVGLALPYAAKVIAAAGLKIGEVDTVASDPEPNVVIATRPPAGAGREPGGQVDVVVSGQPRIRTSQATRALEPLVSGARP